MYKLDNEEHYTFIKDDGTQIVETKIDITEDCFTYEEGGMIMETTNFKKIGKVLEWNYYLIVEGREYEPTYGRCAHCGEALEEDNINEETIDSGDRFCNSCDVYEC